MSQCGETANDGSHERVGCLRWFAGWCACFRPEFTDYVDGLGNDVAFRWDESFANGVPSTPVDQADGEKQAVLR